MKINIHQNRKVSLIQEEFSGIFPFLNLEFLDLSQNEMMSYTSAGIRNTQLHIGELRQSGANGDLHISYNMTIMQLENLLQDHFGLKAQVFVRAGDQWVRPSLNGYWMLVQKNEEGRRNCQVKTNPPLSV